MHLRARACRRVAVWWRPVPARATGSR